MQKIKVIGQTGERTGTNGQTLPSALSPCFAKASQSIIILMCLTTALPKIYNVLMDSLHRVYRFELQETRKVIVLFSLEQSRREVPSPLLSYLENKGMLSCVT